MSGEDGKLKENSRQATIESIMQLYERGELHQHYQHLASPKISGDEFPRCFLRENPSSIYFLAQLIEEVTGESTAAPAVYRLLSKKQKKKVIDARHYSKESFFSFFRFIRSATKEQLQRYGHPAGLYFLAVDMETQGGAHPGQLYRCVGKKKWLQYLVGERAIDISWQPRSLDLSVIRIDAACNFLKDSYHKDREQFFNVYGSKAGCVLLAQKLKESLVRLSMLLSSTEVLTAIMDISDEEFEKRFNPYPVRLPLKVVEAALETLQSAYLASTEAFFERYGSRLGVVHLARDLITDGACKYINIEGLSSMLRDGEMVFQLLSHFLDAGRIDNNPLTPQPPTPFGKGDGKGEQAMSSRFKPWYITLPLATIEALIQFLKERYNEDAASFFARYGAEKGVFALAKDLEVEKKLSVHLTQLSNLLADGKELAKLLQIEDSRFFSSWKPSTIRLSLKVLEAVVAFLKERFVEDREGFLLFASLTDAKGLRYGKTGGGLLLAKELKQAKINVSLTALCELIRNKSLLASLMEIKEDALAYFSPRIINLSSNICKKVLELLKKRYAEDSENFFSVYGGEAGSFMVARELKEAGVCKDISMVALLSLLKDGRLLAGLLGVDDERFLSKWNPRALKFSLSTFERILSFLKRKYEEDREMFFSRYGQEPGIIHLARDISREEKLEIHLGSLSSIPSGQPLSQLLGVEDTRFLTDWHPRVLNLPTDAAYAIIDFLRDEYAKGEDRFLSIYPSELGEMIIAKEIHNRTGHKLDLFRIHQVVGDGEMVAFLVGGSIEPPNFVRGSRESGRFAREWQPASMRMNLYSMEEKAKKWASYLLFFKGLPPLDAELDDRKPLASVSLANRKTKSSVNEVNSLEEYISFRWLARQSKLQGTLRFFQLFVPEKYEDIEKVILSSIEQDRKQLKNIEKEDEFVKDTLKNRFALKRRYGMEGEASVLLSSLSRLEALLFSTGQLLYSFSEHIRMSARDKLIDWFAPLLPEYYPTPEHESEAMAILLALATTHDVYTYVKRGRNQYPPFSNYLRKFLSFLNAKVFWKKIPVSVRKKLSKILRFERRFFLEHGWEPGVEEISIGTGLSEDAVLRTKELSYWIYTAVIFEDTSEIETKRLYASVPTS